MTDITPTSHTDLQAQLASPQGAAIRAAHQARLRELITSIRTQLNRGVSPADYAIGRALETAVSTASEILDQLIDTSEHPPTGLPAPVAASPPARSTSPTRRP